MTNRNYIRPYSAGMAIKKPRLRRIEIGIEGPPPPTPEGISNGVRPHGGFRGMKHHPPGQFSFNKDESYMNDIQDGYQVLLNQENQETHGAPYWVPDVQREITHSGESPLFTNKLLASGKFEQEHGVINMDRALLSTQPRRQMSAPRRRHLNGVKEFYRPNSTHQYLSATDLRNLEDSEEVMVKYGRPTRTTLLRARQRSASAINSYDVRRQANKRMEEVKTNTIFYTAKEYINIYQTDGETMHSFLTGARYNRAHLLDSKGLSVYGVYMPRENPTECFIAGQRKMKDVGDDIPSAPPDSPRSDVDENSLPAQSRPTSSSRYSVVSRGTSSRPGSSRPPSKTTSSRPPSHRRAPPMSLSLRPRSAKEVSSASHHSRPHPPRSADSNRRRELPLPDEVTMAMPDHVNKGKGGVYVTLKGQKIIESVESKLPRVTGYSLPKIRNKSRDFMDEMQVVNQPPPTPVEPSVISFDKMKLDANELGNRFIVNENKAGDGNELQTVGDDQGNSGDKDKDKDDGMVLGEVVMKENLIDERKTLEIRPAKHVNFTGINVTPRSVDESEKAINVEHVSEGDKETVTESEVKVEPSSEDDNVIKSEVKIEVNSEPVVVVEAGQVEEVVDDVKKVKSEDNVVFFMTEDGHKGDKKGDGNDDVKGVDGGEEGVVGENIRDDVLEDKTDEIEEADKSVDDVIKVEIVSEADKSKDKL